MAQNPLITYKILVLGMRDAGRTSFLAALSEIPIIVVEKDLFRDGISIFLEFGRFPFENRDEQSQMLFLFGTRAYEGFDFPFEVIAEGFLGLILLLDNAATETFPQTRKTLFALWRRYSWMPIVIAANKQDIEGAWSVEDLRIVLRIPPEFPIIPCIASDKQSVANVLIALCEEVLREIDAGEAGA